MTNMSPRFKLAFGAATLLAVSMAAGYLWSPSGHAGSALPAAPNAAGPGAQLRMFGIQPCGSDGGFLADVAVINSGHTVADLSGLGYGGAPLFQAGGTIQSGPAGSPLVVVSAEQLNVPVVTSLLVSSHIASTAEVMKPQASESLLQSCNYHLADNAAALGIAQKAFTAMENDGLATSAQINDPMAIWMVTDDPSDNSKLFVIAALNSGSVPATGTNPHLSRTAIAAWIDKATGDVLEIGPTNIYATP